MVMLDSMNMHVAIIMDGNGRWAKARGLPRTAGHQQGIEAVKRTVRAAAEQGVTHLTLFGFSTENWSRPPDEIHELMRLLRFYLQSQTADLHKNNIRLRVIGFRDPMDSDIIRLIDNAETLTSANTGLNVTIALNYGGQADIVQAAMHFARKNDLERIDLETAMRLFPRYLMTDGLPSVDLLIRTSGEHRISNFLLWPCAYAELVFTQTLWPDFDAPDLIEALADYKGRDRRFGGLTPPARTGMDG